MTKPYSWLDFKNLNRKSLQKDQIINEEDKIILFKAYKKIKKEFSELENK